MTSPISLLSRDQVAALLGISPWTVRAWVKRGRFPRPIRLSECAADRWREVDILIWLTRLQKRPPRQSPRGMLRPKPPKRRIERVRFVPRVKA
jgi:predicted DNA-binding transcriptional regulator AlpA